jgi:uncharacterized protein (TIGR03435 family)
MNSVLVFAILSIVALRAEGQAALERAPRPAFEVSSVHPADVNDERPGLIGFPPGRLSVTNTGLKALIWWAYELQPYQIAGGPGWAESAKWNIEAKGDSTAVLAQIRLMTQSLLADRFKLDTHWETRQDQFYKLVIAKGGPKFREAADPTKLGSLRFGTGLWAGQARPLSAIVNLLTRHLGRYVIDDTGLTSNYDFELRFTPDSVSPAADGVQDANAPSIFTALREQLGLRLESARGPVKVLVIDRAERPSEN